MGVVGGVRGNRAVVDGHAGKGQRVNAGVVCQVFGEEVTESVQATHVERAVLALVRHVHFEGVVLQAVGKAVHIDFVLCQIQLCDAVATNPHVAGIVRQDDFAIVVRQPVLCGVAGGGIVVVAVGV